MNRLRICSAVFLGIIWIVYLSMTVYAIKDRFEAFDKLCHYSDSGCIPKENIGE